MIATTLTLSLALSKLDLSQMEAEIAANKFPKVTSVLVDQDGTVVYERYFGEGSGGLLNDSRSVTKTFTALVAGIAGHEKRIAIETTKVRTTMGVASEDPAWNDTTVGDLLTMSSPIAADDSDGQSPGNEDRMHEHGSWTPFILGLPTKQNIKRGADSHFPFCYATVNAVLAGQVVQKLVKVPLDTYMTDRLLKPLGIRDRKYQYSKHGEVMSGGGLRLRTRDLAKIGRLILDGGKYRKKQIVPKAWIQKMLTSHRKDTVMPGVDYGYLVWRIDFGGKGGQGQAWCMLGNGGNIVAMFPKSNTVVTITRTDYNSGSTPAETMLLVGQLILPNLK